VSADPNRPVACPELPPTPVDRRAFLMSAARLGAASAMFAGISLLILRDASTARASDPCVVARDCGACGLYPRCMRPKAQQIRNHIQELAQKMAEAEANDPDFTGGAEDEQLD